MIKLIKHYYQNIETRVQLILLLTFMILLYWNNRNIRTNYFNEKINTIWFIVDGIGDRDLSCHLQKKHKILKD